MNFIYLLLLSAIAFGNDAKGQLALENKNERDRNALAASNNCLLDYIHHQIRNSTDKFIGLCNSFDDVGKNHKNRVFNIVRNFNRTEATFYFGNLTDLQLSIVKYAFDEKVRDFFIAGGTRCIKKVGHEIMKTVEDSIFIQNKTNIQQRITQSLLRIDRIPKMGRKQCTESGNIKKHIGDIFENACNITSDFVKSVHDYLSGIYCKNINEKPAARNPRNNISIIYAAIVIIILVIILSTIIAAVTNCMHRKKYISQVEHKVTYHSNAPGKTHK